MNIRELLSNIEPRRRKQLALAVLVIIASFAAMSLYYLFSRGTLVVSTNDPTATISISRDGTAIQSAEATNRLAATLPVGGYTVTVRSRSGDASTKQTVTVSPLTTTDITVNIPKAALPVPVTNMQLLFPNFQPKALAFYDPNQDAFAAVDTTNTLRYDKTLFRDVISGVWVDHETGYFVAKRGYNDPYSVMYYRAGTWRVITTSTNNNLPISIALNQAGTLYLINNTKLYRLHNTDLVEQGTVAAGSRLYAAHDERLVLLAPGEGAVDNQPDFSYRIVVTDTQGRTQAELTKTTSESPDAANDIAWSPDGSRLLFTDGFHAIIYDANLKETGRLPDGLARSPQWETNASLVYAGGNNLWRYNLEEQSSSSIGSVAQAYKVFDIAPPLQDGTLYFMAGSNRYASWYRLQPESPIPSESLRRIAESDTREIATNCSLNYMYITRLTAIVNVDTDIHKPDSSRGKKAIAGCTASVSRYFLQMGITLDAARIQTIVQQGVVADD